MIGKYPIITLCGSTRGYIGQSTRSEIEYAKANGKEIIYHEYEEDFFTHTCSNNDYGLRK